VHDAAQEAELLGCVPPILADVVLGSSGVRSDPLIEVRGPRENVGRMPLLWNFHHGGVLQLLSREFGICGRLFWGEVAVDVADDGHVWGFAG
jgi:hypothetical protein